MLRIVREDNGEFESHCGSQTRLVLRAIRNKLGNHQWYERYRIRNRQRNETRQQSVLQEMYLAQRDSSRLVCQVSADMFTVKVDGRSGDEPVR